jgi:hypothetical protein
MREELQHGLVNQQKGSILTTSSIVLVPAHMKSPVYNIQ